MKSWYHMKIAIMSYKGNYLPQKGKFRGWSSTRNNRRVCTILGFNFTHSRPTQQKNDAFPLPCSHFFSGNSIGQIKCRKIPAPNATHIGRRVHHSSLCSSRHHSFRVEQKIPLFSYSHLIFSHGQIFCMNELQVLSSKNFVILLDCI